jgi:prolyl-tRNA synthetase
MVIRPSGYIWERMQRTLDDMFKATGHKNAYFPLFIPESFLHKEAEHVQGFAPEAAVVTHGGGKKLEEPLVVRPTSETIIYSMYAKWVQSYRDLPILINQWANVVRWEMRTRLFLRTLEFLWQEGHTAHATHDEAQEETRKILGLYRDFMEGWMAMPSSDQTDSNDSQGTPPIVRGRDAGQQGAAGRRRTIWDRTSRGVRARSRPSGGQGMPEHGWGVSLARWRLVMTHGDDTGLRVPPLLAPTELVSFPFTGRMRRCSARAAGRIEQELGAWEQREPNALRVHVDRRDGMKPGAKYRLELRGVRFDSSWGPGISRSSRACSSGATRRRRSPCPSACSARKSRSCSGASSRTC